MANALESKHLTLAARNLPIRHVCSSYLSRASEFPAGRVTTTIVRDGFILGSGPGAVLSEF